ncbi:MAG: hypothetical protein MUF19_00175 [Candidatus Pacebacteria bacterium]|jgi:hypothetical protein|nr:hypothetical protein [Candidatus Paceibacterota bacterium]
MTTKSTVKKVAQKKATTKKVKKLKAEVVHVPAELAFWTIDGRALHSLEEMADALKDMAGRVYRYHADKDHQDFAAWVATVFQQKEAAKLLKTAATAKSAEKIIRSVLQGKS